jgi:putative DNA modification/repair radical SAM protein
MSLQSKLAILADAAKYDVSCASSGSTRAPAPGRFGHSEGKSICHSFTPDGRCVSLLKILFTNYCMYDCVFCVNRVSSDIPRACFSPEEVAQVTMDFYRRNYIEGLFLSSGIFQSPDSTMEQLIRSVRLLRTDHAFNGYIHLKAIPGASRELIHEAGRWVDRLSANIELPTQADLTQLAPDKRHAVIEQTMAQIQNGVVEHVDRTKRPGESFAPAGQTTQMVIGATPASDADILMKSDLLYRTYRLRRVYYSAFSPYPKADPRLPVQAPPLLREHRLYQADWLMRHYEFTCQDLTEQPTLSLDYDPKLSWALRHRDRFPVDINNGDREELLRIPGIGYKNVARILSIRRYHRLNNEDLRRLGIALNRAAPFIVTADSGSATQLDRSTLPRLMRAPRQLQLFEAASEAETGQL